MEDFNWESGKEITSAISGKTVVKCENVDASQDNFLQFEFSDGTVLRFRYDYIYEYGIGVVAKNTGDKEKDRLITDTVSADDFNRYLKPPETPFTFGEILDEVNKLSLPELKDLAEMIQPYSETVYQYVLEEIEKRQNG